MTTTNSRDYNCKDEELPVICTFASTSLKRDLADFKAYSPKFDRPYVAAFDTAITSATDIVEPQTETMERKLITARLRTSISALLDPINHLSGYITLSPALTMSPTDFGITQLRKSIIAIEPEGVIAGLHLVNANVAKYREALVAQGLTDELAVRLATAAATINADKQKQAEILSNRRSIVQENVSQLNGLHGQLNEILTVGKILYKATNPAKLQDYTFSNLKKQVHATHKATNGDTAASKKNTPGNQAGAKE